MEADELTHEEIWDDSALFNSWNQALEEYKVSTAFRAAVDIHYRHIAANPVVQKYHSIHAQGGSVDDILDLQEP